MERFFLFCFRSCLKGENDNELYTVLEISDPSSATTETIKKAYKKRSLSLHPVSVAFHLIILCGVVTRTPILAKILDWCVHPHAGSTNRTNLLSVE